MGHPAHICPKTFHVELPRTREANGPSNAHVMGHSFVVSSLDIAPILISWDAGYALTQDEGMHVVRTLIGLYGFQIHHVPHDWIIVRDAVGAENVPGYARAFQRHPDIISFRHGDVVMTNCASIFHAAHL